MGSLPVPLGEYRDRVEKCRALAGEAGFQALLVCSHSPDRPGHVRYLSNYYAPCSFNASSLPGEAFRRGMADSCVLVPANEEPVLMKAEVPWEHEIAINDVRDYPDDIVEMVAKVVQEKRLDKATIGIAGEDVVSAYILRSIREKLPGVRFAYADHLVEQLRQVKSRNEIELMRKTAELSDKALQAAVEAVRPGVRERDVAAVAAGTMLREGAERVLFNDVQSGPNSELVIAWPMAGDRIIQEDDVVMIDLGGQDENGYFFDVARTTVAGNPSKAKRDLLRLGREATDFVAESARAGLGGVEWMEKTNVFVKERMETGQYGIAQPDPVMFIGHGMGLDMEALWYVPGADTKLREGMILSIEPWIRVSGLGASRFEDLMLVTEKRGELLNKYRHAT